MTQAELLADRWTREIRPRLDCLGVRPVNSNIEDLACLIASQGEVIGAHFCTEAAIRLAAMVDDVISDAAIDETTYPWTEGKCSHPCDRAVILLVLSVLDREMTTDALADMYGAELYGEDHRAILLHQINYAAYAATMNAWELADAE